MSLLPRTWALLDWIEHHPGTAAWVQAGGAIIALAIAIAIPIWSAKAADRRSRKRFLSSVASICGEVQGCFANAAEKCSASAIEGLLFVRSVQAYHRFRIVSSAVNAIPLYKLPSYEVTRSVIELQAMMAEGLMQLDAAFKEIDTYQELVQHLAYGEAFEKLAARACPYLAQIDSARSSV